MKIIHTSDWHLGQVLYDYDRSEEQRDMLCQITAIVAKEQPDALVVSGDVFHTGSPSSTAVEMYNEAILAMHDACPTMQIVITAGNHDSAARLVVNNALWEHFGVTVVGHIAKHADELRTPDYAAHIVRVRNEDGRAKGLIAAIPHCYDSNYPALQPDLQRHERAKAYYEGMTNYIRTINTEQLPVVLMAHTAVVGCDMSGHDMIGGMESREASILGNGYDYVALGHIHTPQNISERIRYSGTPIPVNFGEKYEHSVSVVQVERGQLPIITTQPIRNLIPLHDFPTQLPEPDAQENELDDAHRPLPFSEVLKRLQAFDASKRCYLRLVVRVDDSLSPLANALIAEALHGKQARYCLIKPFQFRRKEEIAQARQRAMLDVGQLKEKSPLEIAQLFFALKGIELTDAKAQMIRIATEKAEQMRKEDHDEA